jgi:hypothetical protein
MSGKEKKNGGAGGAGGERGKRDVAGEAEAGGPGEAGGAAAGAGEAAGAGAGRRAEGAWGAAPALPPWPRPLPAHRGARAGVYLALAVLGVVTALAGALVQSGWFPGGLILALAAAVGVFWGGGKLCRTRAGAVAPAAGWVVTVLLLTTTRPEGDFLFGAGIGSYVFLLGGMLAAVMCATIALPAPPVPARNYR